MRKKQKVVLRSKVRANHRLEAKSFLFTASKFGLAAALLFFAAYALNDFLFRKGAFMVKSVTVKTQGELTAKISKELERFKGHLIFWLDSGKMKELLKKRYPSILAIKIRRLFPDKVEVEYALRSPLAKVKMNQQTVGVDAEGKTFPLSPQAAEAGKLPEIELKNSANLLQAVRLVEFWSKKSLQHPGLALGQVTADETGEFSLKVAEEGNPITLIWGEPDPANFEVKFSRWINVMDDLKQKAVQASAVNLRGVPEMGGSTLENHEKAGRVVVTLVKK